MRSRVFLTLSITGTAEIFLLAVGGWTVAHQGITLTMRTMNRDGYHDILLYHIILFFTTTPYQTESNSHRCLSAVVVLGVV